MSAGNFFITDWEFGKASALIDRQELDYLFSLTYEELRRLASTVRRGDPSATLNTTALVNEAWLKLARSPRFALTSPLHFKRIAARAMRQLLVEAARRRKAEKRVAPENADALEYASGELLPRSEDLLSLDMAIEELSRMNARQAVMVEARFFGGLEIGEMAELLNCSEATVLRDWRAARAWLALRLKQA